MATATTTPMMTAVSTLPEPGVSEGGGGGGEEEEEGGGGRRRGGVGKGDTPLLQVLSSVNTKYKCLNRELYTQFHVSPTWYGDLLRYRRGGAVLVSDSDSDRVGP